MNNHLVPWFLFPVAVFLVIWVVYCMMARIQEYRKTRRSRLITREIQDIQKTHDILMDSFFDKRKDKVNDNSDNP